MSLNLAEIVRMLEPGLSRPASGVGSERLMLTGRPASAPDQGPQVYYGHKKYYYLKLKTKKLFLNRLFLC
jgi:hypothetical protein